jgi:acid phosphatase class B
LNISLDYDDTYTRDPECWDLFIELCKYRGHTIYVITARSPSEGAEVIDALQKRVGLENIFFTSRKAKKQFIYEKQISIDVWIDDAPWFILNDGN